MPNFTYIIKDSKGVRQDGMIQADNLDEALNKLYERGATVISINSVKEDEYGSGMSLMEKASEEIYKMRNRVPLTDLVFFTRQLATMFSAGLTIEKAMSNLITHQKNKKFRSILIEINKDIKSGLNLSEAMEKHPGVFSDLYVALVHSGEISGTLHVILNNLSEYLESVEDTRRKVISALSYPFFVLGFLVVVVAVLIAKIVPMFENVYARFGADLPLPTQTLVNISELVRNNFLLAILVIIGVIIAIFLLRLTDRGRYAIDTFKLKFPIFGPLVNYAIQSRFARTFGILMGSGIPILEAMKLLQKVVENRVIEIGIIKSKNLIKNGYSIAESLEKADVFLPTLLQLVATGEETGEMNSLLMKAAAFYDKLVDSKVTRLTSLIEPLLIIFTGVVIGAILVVIYLPVFYLGLAIKRGMQ